MSTFIAARTRKPTAAQKTQITKGLKTIDNHLVLCIGAAPGEAAMYVEAPDEYGASHMAEKAQAVRDLVGRVMA